MILSKYVYHKFFYKRDKAKWNGRLEFYKKKKNLILELKYVSHLIICILGRNVLELEQ